jgi:hypothetical protein
MQYREKLLEIQELTTRHVDTVYKITGSDLFIYGLCKDVVKNW